MSDNRMKQYHCPKCKSENIIPILFGYPSKEAIGAAESGELILGGCEMPRKKVNAYCKNCERRFLIKK